jgi:hypothetical protein
MKKLVILLILTGCTFEVDVPVDEIEVPPIENNTTIVVNFPDGLTLPTEEQDNDVQTVEEKQCEYQHFPDYYSYGAFVLGCTGDVDNSNDFVCCTWVFPEDHQACEERWCRDSDNKCGWGLNSWQCYSY